MLSKEILLKIEWKDMDTVVLTNSKGDTYTSKSEELQDFLHGEPPPPVQSDSGVDNIYPLTIVADRYNGIYSGGKFTAWKRNFQDVPIEINCNDVVCEEFWHDNKIPFGKGSTPNAAYINLSTQLI